MKFFIDTADVAEIRDLAATGLVDGITTNPSLVAKSGRDFFDVLREICDIVPGPVSAEVAATDPETMLAEGRVLAAVADNIAVKVPLTPAGLKTCKTLSGDGVKVNVTLCFSPAQAILAAKAGATYISPFVGRLDDIATDGMNLIADIVEIYEAYPDFSTEVLVASVRHPIHVVEAGKIGAHVVTLPPAVLRAMFRHPLTDKGLEGFLSDWAKTGQSILKQPTDPKADGNQNQSDAAPDGPNRKRPAETPLNGEDLNAAQVADYLQRNPDFLVGNPELIEVLLPPNKDRGDGVIDLQRYMVERLRDSVSLATAARDDLVSIGRTNLAAQTRVHTAVLALMSSRSFEHLIETVTTDLAIMLDLDAAALGVEQSTQDAPPMRLGGIFQLEPDTVDAVIGPGRTIALRSDIEGDPAIFGAAAGLVRSEALIRLTISKGTPPALLALGSRDAEQFHSGQGTELMSFMAQALEKCVRAWLNLPD